MEALSSGDVRLTRRTLTQLISAAGL